MDIPTICVAGKETADLVCSKCGNSRQIFLAGLPDAGNVFKIKCRCGYSYRLMFDKRRFNRKKTCLKGVYSSSDNRMYEDIIDIIDLSMTGLCFSRIDNRDLYNGQIVFIRFRLDNHQVDKVNCKAIVRHACNNRVGIEFLDLSPKVQRTIGFYLFNYPDKSIL
jgi:hypothetical protein